jgi:hypothetical protein
MRQPQVVVPDPYTLGSHWGLSWILMTWDGHDVFGHDGGTIGQSAFLRVDPVTGVAACLLTNGGHTQDLFRDLFGEIFGELAGISMPPRPQPPAGPVEGLDLDRYVGRYAREGIVLDIARTDEHLTLKATSTGPLASALGEEEEPPLDVLPVAADLFVTRRPGDSSWTPLVFFRLDDGSDYVHFGARATPRTS